VFGELELLIGVVLRRSSRPAITNVLSWWQVGVLRVWEEGRWVSLESGRVPFREVGEASEKVVGGWVDSEGYRGIQRYPVWYVSGLGRAQKWGQDTGSPCDDQWLPGCPTEFVVTDGSAGSCPGDIPAPISRNPQNMGAFLSKWLAFKLRRVFCSSSKPFPVLLL